MWPFTPSKNQIIKELKATINKATLDIKALANNLDTVRSELNLRTQHLHKRQDEVSTLAKRVTELLKQNESLVSDCNSLRLALGSLDNLNKDKEAQILELTGFAEVLKSEIQAQKDLYATDTHNLLLQIAALDPGTMSKAEPEVEPKPQLVQVTEDFFGKLAAELTAQWQKATTQINVDGAAHGKVSDRLSAVQKPSTHDDNVSDFFTQSTTQAAHTRTGKDNVPTTLPKPTTQYIPSPDFAASFDEGATQVDGQSVATGLSITQPATGPIKLPSQMVAEFEAPYNPE